MIKDSTTTRRKIIDQFSITDIDHFKERVLNWAKQFDTFCFLDDHQYKIPPHSIECICAVGVEESIESSVGNALEKLQGFLEKHSGRPLFGHLGYDLKNEIEPLSSSHIDPVGFPDLFFFAPKVLIRIGNDQVLIEAEDPPLIFNAIREIIPEAAAQAGAGTMISSRFTKAEYVSVIQKLRQHILRGDCYEINFCQEFYIEKIQIDPASAFLKLGKVSPNPFSALYRIRDHWLMGASPERFLKREGNSIISQPIKGTSKRDKVNVEKDNENRHALQDSAKDRAENVMVVDLVRNDLGRICKEGTVNVDELFGIYSFPQVHQMISTVRGELKENIKFKEIIKACFPMGSMTGAPKRRVMELIEDYEKTRRGLFSGAIGYIDAAGFDFNVVIRSMLYNMSTGYLSFPAGSGITFYSEPEKEWEECRMKAEAIRSVLGND